jgi:hypothetical protein
MDEIGEFKKRHSDYFFENLENRGLYPELNPNKITTEYILEYRNELATQLKDEDLEQEPVYNDELEIISDYMSNIVGPIADELYEEGYEEMLELVTEIMNAISFKLKFSKLSVLFYKEIFFPIQNNTLKFSPSVICDTSAKIYNKSQANVEKIEKNKHLGQDFKQVILELYIDLLSKIEEILERDCNNSHRGNNLIVDSFMGE